MSLPKRSLKQDQRILFSFVKLEKLRAELEQNTLHGQKIIDSINLELTHLKELCDNENNTK